MFVTFPRGNRERPKNPITTEAISFFSNYIYRADFSLQVVKDFLESKTFDELKGLDIEEVLIVVDRIKVTSEQPELVPPIFEYLATQGLRLNLETLHKTTWVMLATRGQQDGFSILNSTLNHIPTAEKAAYLTKLRYKRIEYFNTVAYPAIEEPLLCSLVGECCRSYPILLGMIDYLLGLGMDPNIGLEEGSCPLRFASASLECTRVLFKHKADPNFALRRNDKTLPFAHVLNFQKPPYSFNDNHYEQSLMIIQLYIEHGAHLNVKDYKDRTINDYVKECFSGHVNALALQQRILNLIEPLQAERKSKYKNALLVLCSRRYEANSVFKSVPRELVKVITGFATLDHARAEVGIGIDPNRQALR